MHMRIKFLKKISIIVFLSLVVLSCDQKVATNSGVPSKAKQASVANEGAAPLKSRPETVELAIEKVSSAEFLSAKQHAKVNIPLEKISDLKIVQKKLAGIVEFEEKENYLGIKKINFRDGRSVQNDVDLSECAFVSYFPSEDVLLLECGHTMDVSFDLATGQTTYEIGNLNYVTTSPSGKYRLNKVFEGQECYSHFIQVRNNGKFKKIAELNDFFEKKTGKWLCVIEQEFWSDDSTLYFGLLTEYKEEGNEYEFYKVNMTNSGK